MRIRRCASRLLGHDYSCPAPPPFELPPPPPFELPTPPPPPPFELPTPPPPPPPPPASVLQPCSSSAHAGSIGRGLSASSAEPSCGHSQSPWDLMALLDPADPQELELFKETYFVSVAFRASWLFPASKPAARVKEEVEDMEEDQQEEEDIGVDMVEEDMAVLDMVEEASDNPWHKVANKKVAKKTDIDDQDWEKNASPPKKKKKKKKKERVKTEEDNGAVADGGGGELWMCKKNDGKTLFCQMSVSQPDSYCLYHSDTKRAPQPAASKPSKRRRKRALDVGEGFYYYAGFGPSHSKRHRSGSSVVESPPAEQKEEAPPEEQEDLTTAQPQADDADHQVAVAEAQVDEPICNDTVGIAGYDEESSDDTFGWNSEPRVVDVNGGTKRKSPLKKRWRKPVKARSLKSLMI